MTDDRLTSMQLTALACGPGGQHVVRGLVDLLTTSQASSATSPAGAEGSATPVVTDHPDPPVELTVIGCTSEDITLCGLRICPDLDAVAALVGPSFGGGGAGDDRESHAVYERLRRLDAAPEWYPLDDATFAAAIARSRWLGAGLTLTEVCARMTGPGRARLVPMSDSPIEAHVVLEGEGERRGVHALEWAARRERSEAPVGVTAAGLGSAHPAPGVLDAVRSADAVIVPLTMPVTGLGVMLGLPGLRDALRGTTAPVIGVSPALLPPRGGEEETLTTLNLDYTSRDMARLFEDILDGYLVPEDEPADLDLGRSDITLAGCTSDPRAIAVDAISLAGRLAGGRR